MVADDKGFALCIKNPCGSSLNKLPHPSTIKDTLFGNSSFDPQDIPCHDATSVQSTNCLPELDEDYSEEGKVTPLTCKKTEEVVEAEIDIFRKKNCGKGKILWSGVKRCVTIFKG